MKLNRPLSLLGLLAAGLLAACTTQDIVATHQCTTPTTPGACEVEQAGYCLGYGPPAELKNGAGATSCGDGGLLAARSFQNALCLCGNYLNTDFLTTDSFDHESPSPVAVNGSLLTQAALQVGGNLTVADAQGISTGAALTVQGNLLDGGRLGVATGQVTVLGDAQVGQNIDLASLRVDGTLTMPDPTQIAVSGTNSVGTIAQGPVTIAPPCPCTASDALNVASLISAHQQDNDNAGIALSADGLVGLRSDITLELPCGRYFLNGISGSENVTLRPTGRVALFISSGISLMKTFSIELPIGSELDLFVNGPFDLSGVPQLGSKDAPSRLRIYVAGTASINMSAGGFLAGNLYAPSSTLAMSDTVEIFGSLFLQSLSATLPFQIHYDSQSAHITSSCL